MVIKSFVATLLLGATPAFAVTWASPTPGPDQGPRATERTVIDFNTAASAPAAYAAGLIRRGTTPGVAAAPAGDTTPYLSVSQGSFPLAAPAAGFDQFSFYWGSVDARNTLEVLSATSAVLLKLTGAQLPRFDGNQLIGATNRRVFFDLGAGETLGGLRFSYDRPAFEIDDVAFGRSTAVTTDASLPKPSTWALLIIGFGMVGIASRRRTRQFAA